jgi:O-succinylbenzoic acid--CoA ligase
MDGLIGKIKFLESLKNPHLLKSNSFHTSFQINGKIFSNSEELIKYSQSISKEINQFLREWFSTDSHVVVKTSGSTGNPKNIHLRKDFMINSALATGCYFQLGENTKALCCLPIKFIAGKMMLVRALTLGWDLDVIESTSNPLQEITKEYDFSAMVPLQLRNSISKIDQIKILIVGGGVVSRELKKAIQTIDTNCYATYGMTETITHIAVKKLNKFSQSELESESVYKTLPDVTISKDKRSCLVIRAPKISDENIITNDVIELISKSEFNWKGRLDHVINSGGVKLHPEEIEQKLSNTIYSRFFVAGILDEILGEKCILVIEGENYPITKKHFSMLSRFEIPKTIFFIPKFIETGSGKIQRLKTLDLL